MMIYLDGAFSTNMSLGRDISLKCIPFGREGSRKSSYGLELLYGEEYGVYKESEADQRIRQENRLKDRKINIKEL